MSGLKLATLYGLRPHQLGLCGPKEAAQQQVLRKFILGKIPVREAKKILQQFKGAYPYYRLIAESNKMKNPFNEKVVAAYWIGNKLLHQVKIADLRRMIARDFSGPGLLIKDVAVKKAAVIPESSKPHHSFHVLTIGSVTGSVDFSGNTKLKDICRIGWGKVTQRVIPAEAGLGVAKMRIQKSGFRIKPGTADNTGKIIVKYQPLVGKKKIKLGKPVKKEIFWDKELAPKVKVGDWVSFHWNYLVRVLTKNDVGNLKKYTKNTLNLQK